MEASSRQCHEASSSLPCKATADMKTRRRPRKARGCVVAIIGAGSICLKIRLTCSLQEAASQGALTKTRQRLQQAIQGTYDSKFCILIN